MRNVKRTMMVLAVLGGLVMSSAACAGPASAPAGSPPAPSSAPAGGGGGGSTGTGTGTGAGTGTSSGAGAGTRAGGHATSTSGTPECRTDDLKVSLTAVPGPYAGSALRHAERLIFTNVSGHSCFEQGYPGVSFVAGDNGTQVGRGFLRDAGTASRITLRAGGQAHATIVTTDAPNACRPVPARGYRVIPPDQFTSVFVSAPQYVCRDTGQADGHVLPMAAGA